MENISVGNGLYWAITTMTTVGYGDITAKTPEGKIIAILVMLVGNRVPYRNRHNATQAERQIVNQRRAQFMAQAKLGLSVEEALSYIKHPGWRWNRE